MATEYTMGNLKEDIERFIESRDNQIADDGNATERDHAREVLGNFVAWLDSSESEKLREELAEARSRIAELTDTANRATVRADQYKAQLDKFNQL